MRTLRTFVKWAQKRGEVGPMNVPVPSVPTRVLDVLTRRETLDMENAAATERDKLIIRMLADLGLRLGELLGLRKEDLIRQKNERYIKVRGKGSRERVVPIDPRLFDRLERYSKRPQAQKALTGQILTTERRHGDHYGPLAARTVQQMIRFTAEAAGITKHVHPHLFRHSNATWQLNAGTPIKHIQENLGHADLAMLTNVYSHITPGDRYESMLALIRKDEDTRR